MVFRLVCRYYANVTVSRVLMLSAAGHGIFCFFSFLDSQTALIAVLNHLRSLKSLSFPPIWKECSVSWSLFLSGASPVAQQP